MNNIQFFDEKFLKIIFDQHWSKIITRKRADRVDKEMGLAEPVENDGKKI